MAPTLKAETRDAMPVLRDLQWFGVQIEAVRDVVLTRHDETGDIESYMADGNGTAPKNQLMAALITNYGERDSNGDTKSEADSEQKAHEVKVRRETVLEVDVKNGQDLQSRVRASRQRTLNALITIRQQNGRAAPSTH